MASKVCKCVCVGGGCLLDRSPTAPTGLRKKTLFPQGDEVLRGFLAV